MDEDTTLVIRDGKAIATINFENDQLVVRAASQAEADRLADSLMQPYMGSKAWTDERGATYLGGEWLEPGTEKHFEHLGWGQATNFMVAEDEEIILPYVADMLNIIPGTFEFSAARSRQPGNG